MTWLTDTRRGVAALTATEHPTLFQFQPAGAYPANGLVPIVGVVLPEKPDEAAALSVSLIAQDVETVVRATFRIRALTEARLDVMEDALWDTWQRRGNTDLAGATLILSTWASGASLGQDGNGRLARSVNYYLTCARTNLAPGA